MKHSYRERNLSDFLDMFVKLGFHPHTVIDVGAAYDTLELYQKFPDSFHLLIEPLKEWEKTLKNICQKNKADYVLAAAGAKPGTTKININMLFSSSSVFERLTGTDEVIGHRDVPVVAIDNVCYEKKLEGPFLIRVDVRGGELDVLNGSRKILENTELIILFVSFLPVYKNGCQYYEVMKYMKDIGFVVYDIFDFSRRSLDKAIVHANIAFVKENGMFRKSPVWATPEICKKEIINFAMKMNPPLLCIDDLHIIIKPVNSVCLTQ